MVSWSIFELATVSTVRVGWDKRRLRKAVIIITTLQQSPGSLLINV